MGLERCVFTQLLGISGGETKQGPITCAGSVRACVSVLVNEPLFTLKDCGEEEENLLMHAGRMDYHLI